jgi:FKBP-type peptidyl-prolyl cis-trans isomerase
MKNKQLLIAIVVLVVLGATVFFTREDSGKSSSSTGSTKSSNQVIETLDATKLASISLTDADGSVTVNQTDDVWTVTDRDGFPANFSDIQSLVNTVTELKILAKQKVGKSQLGRFELNDPGSEDAKDAGTKLELKDADGKVLQSILFGKESQGQADPSSPFGPSGTGRYVLVGENTVGEINETLSSDLKTDPADWLNKEDFLKVEKIKSIAVAQSKTVDSWALSRDKEGEDMSLVDSKEGEKLDSSKGNSAGRVFGYPSFDDVASKSAKSEDIGMDKAVTTTIDTFEGYKYVVKLAKKEEDHYISFTASGTRIPQEDERKVREPEVDETKPREPGKDEKPEDKERLDKEHADSLAKLIADREKTHKDNQSKLKTDRDKEFKENLDKLAKLEGWTFKVSSYTFDAIYKTRAEMMEEKKEEESDESTSTETTTSGDDVAQKNKEAGESFLAANKDKEGVMSTDSGLQYKVTKEGDGPSPDATDSVTVNYKGTLIDGTEFDSGKAISFPLNGVIKGWTEGLQLMKTGGSTRFFIPSGLAYGTTGSGPKIGPNSTLIFDVDLLSVKGKEAAKAPAPATIDPAKTDPKKIVTSDIIKVPSAEEMKKGAKIEVIKKEDLPGEIEKAREQSEKKADDKK